MKILLVEDELTSRRTLISFLHPIGEVDICVNGNIALNVAKKALENNQPYELIFLDIMISNLDGISTLKKIRQLETQHGVKEHAKSKVIMTSANTDKDVILKAAQAGCTSYMIKPIDKKRLYNEIRKHGFETSE
jgi:two-component system chemotaxis response regulator CheY